MSSPYQPEPGCTARQRQLEQQVHDLRQQLRAAEDELGERRGRENRERRYRLAWQSARRRAAAAEARVAELEPDGGDWPGGWPYGPLLPLFVPEQLGAAFGDGGQKWWALAIDERRQRDLVQQRLADYLAANPVPGVDGCPPAPPEPPPAITFEGMAKLINEYRMPEQPAVPRREMQRSEPSSTGLTVVTADPVQEIAAEPATLEALKRRYFGEPASRLGVQLGQIGQFFGFPMIPDADLPPGEVHMRPHPHTTEVHESYVWEDEGEWKVSCDDCPAYVDNIGNEDDAKRWAAEHRAGERQP